MPSPPTSPRPLRLVMWLLVLLAGYWLVRAIQAGREDGDGAIGPALAMSALSLVLAGWLGVRGARERARAQAAAAQHAAQMLLVAQLGRQDDATLEQIAARGGPAGEAAAMILQGRHLGNPTGTARSTLPES